MSYHLQTEKEEGPNLEKGTRNFGGWKYFWGDGNTLYIDCGDGFTSIYIFQN